ncbi:MAG: hypothetical protein COC12_14050 [Rhodobacteraceae bacterium]|nr:MAG: hypothetical protein COC12_14050 [Paracoccaceae bacterium]
MVSCAPTEQGYTPSFDPSQHKGPQYGLQNQVLVLGTPHLSGLPDSFRIDELTPLINRLAMWGPQIITIESISGQQCEFMRNYPDQYKDNVEAYCWDATPALTATGLNVAQATAETEQLLAQWPENPKAADRRNLAALFLASADRASALVQWLRLPENERYSGDGLDDTLVALLNALTTKQNENYQIAAPLAARLGLERLYPIDDHTAGFVYADEEAYGAAIMKAWDNPALQKRKEIGKALYANLGTTDGLLEIYRSFNAPKMALLIFESDFGAALEDPSPQAFGRGYVTYWETRNLRMAANIRDVFGGKPGSRALVIIGASHKAYLESYLNQMHDMRIVDAEKVLR